MLLANQRIRVYLLDGIVVLLAGFGIYVFWTFEPSTILRFGIALLLIFSLWRIIQKDNAPALFLIGFVDTTVLFRIIDGQLTFTLSPNIAAIVLFCIVLFLFAYRHVRFSHHHFVTQLFSIYNSLLALLIGELFFILTFFNIDAKNKAILIVLWLWLYDELIEGLEENRLTQRFVLTTTSLFAILFIGISLTFTFITGF